MKYSKDNLIFLPLGGSGEIGMNCNLYHFNNEWIMVDLGVTFSDNESNYYDLIVPNIDFIVDKINNLTCLILTHAHEDHIGAVPYLIDKLGKVPIYTTPFTASVLKRKFISVGIENYPINLLEYGKEKEIGSFKVKIFCMTHSIPEPNAILLKTSKGTIFHTGDWKIDPQPLVGNPINENELKEFVGEDVDVMVCDSTNVFDNEPSGSENDVRDNLRKVFNENKDGKIIITCFASNIARLETILTISSEFNKCCLLLGRSLNRIYESARENNYLSSCNNIISEKEAKIVPEEDLVVICTGSQGENRAALSRLVNGRHKYLRMNKGDLVIFSSREIPGNEKRINDVKSIVIKNGCKMLDHTNSKIHVSGHPSKSELQKLYEWVNPKLLIPTHGEFRHLEEHINFAKKCGLKKQLLAENGDLIKLDKGEKNSLIGKVNAGRKVLKGNKIIPIDHKLLNGLNVIASDGEVFVNIIMNTNDKLLAEPVIFCPSILIEDSEKNELRKLIKESLNDLIPKCIDDEVLCNEMKIKVRSYLKIKTGLKPLTFIEIVRI